ncbi:TonB-dependent receptor plug domain-containing protein [Novosphingobium humi]|uniref:TonB-dependent receptor n=1 Tax=Novosphingobium humi TaxID=2282397 RepID=A0ABY7TXW7_9SPHN|nr:TonB-dependent receptor [Novosphingobium humi]WCT76964.1 TonB-dependent receptor [Novosphingobium humi]
MKKLLFTTTALALFAPMAAQAAEADQAEPSSEIIVTGTRQTGMKAADSAAPIQLIGTQAFQSVGQQDLTQVLAQTLPSLNFQGFGGDTANLTLSAALRGINPNDTLVLINGKRRHTTANLAVLGGSPYSGSATTDLSFVPTNAIGRIEVLQDGAAAQYGSDAIAGVVNIMLKSADHGGSFTATGGSNYENGGKTAATALNLGFKLGEKGFVNVTGEYKFHDYTSHGNYDRRYFYPDGTLKPGQSAVIVNGLKGFAGYPNVNNINGDARYSIYNLSFNAGYDVGSDAQVYAFGTYGNRNAKAFENYRAPNRVSGTTSTGTTVYPLPNGFQPQENIREEDFSLTAGIKGKAAQWNYDLSLTYGKDAVALYTINSANPTLFSMAQSASPTALTGLQRNFYDGQLSNSEWVGNIDISRDFDLGMAKPLTLAFGGEYRQGNYSITSGEYGSYAFGGAQSYPGFAPTDAGSYGRNSYAGYIDVAADPIAGLHVDVAGRYEHYSDFGSAWSGKFNARYDFSPAFAIRGTVSNGFRAPTLAESYYSSVNVGPGSTFGQLPPNSAAAQLLGFSKLKAEKSTNFSFGFVAHPLPKLQITVDAYQIKIRDRIVASGDIYGFNSAYNANNGIVSQAVQNALISRGVSLADATSYSGINIFTNGADTRTRGVEATATYSSDFGDMGKVDWSLGANYNKTEITRISPLPTAVYNAGFGQTDLLSASAKDALTTATPRVKLIGNALWNIGQFSVNLRETMYGSTSQHTVGAGDGLLYLQHIGTTFITDLNVGYKLTPKIRFDAGANNLFDKQAPTTRLQNDGSRPISGNVYNSPISFTPWGINGGYYYARVTVNF